MELLEKCKNWLEQEDYGAIIKSLSQDPKVQMTPELAIMLAKAYHGLAQGWEDRWMYEEVVKILKEWKDWGEYQYEWNLLFGVAYFNLDQKMVAMEYLQQALKERPNDQTATLGLGHCLAWMERPSFQEPFAKRVEAFWTEFSKNESYFSKLATEGISSETDVETIEYLHDITKETVGAINIDIGHDDGKNYLTLSPGGDWCKFHELVFLERKMPENLKKRWTCFVGYQQAPNWKIPADQNPDDTISLSDVSVWLEKHENGSYTLSAYCEKLVDNVKKQKDRAITTLEWLVNVAIGELPRMYYFYHVEPLEEPKADPSIPLTDLAKIWAEKGYAINLDPSFYYINPISYETPVLKGGHSAIPNQKQRWDIMEGCSNCKELINDYESGKDKHANALIADGAAPGFIFFAPPFDKKQENDKNIDLLAELQDALLTEPSSQALTIVGASFGVVFWYLDFIAWDIKAVIKVAEKFFKEHYSRFSGFQLFMQDAKPLVWDGDKLKDEEDDNITYH